MYPRPKMDENRNLKAQEKVDLIAQACEDYHKGIIKNLETLYCIVTGVIWSNALSPKELEEFFKEHGIEEAGE